MSIANQPSGLLDDERVRAVLTRAWAEHGSGPAADPIVQSFLSAAAAAAHRAIGPEPDPARHNHSDDELCGCVARLVEDARANLQRRAAAQAGTDRHRRALHRLQADIRTAALDALATQPRLAQSLASALQDWGMPPIPTPHTVTLQVPIVVHVDAAGDEEARNRATDRLRDELHPPYGMDIDISEAVCTDLTGE
ncbi:hypothetical protein [Phytohabitans rumicis]|uniref:Uncharacterized protein n=1 Tax=Phytohabitans rumicis TaxID=1076125 RepID=A0A6V8LCF3_9ACTN|nr:hypothetical protein [Phytohabitans rumicis]GFJ93330.1 hypothetical protein Prum_069720 [Phytohabitans rumicis]